MKNLFFIFICAWIALLSFGQNGGKAPLDSAVNNIVKQVLLFPQEKIYLQTDKPYYISGEKIFFRLFLLNAFSHQPTAISRYVYVELINGRDSIVIRQQIRPENQMYCGALVLPENLPSGNYRIRAYTRFMENIGGDYFFICPVYISDPEAVNSEIEPIFISDPDEKFEVTFYPEGGNLIAGQSCIVAFKALSSSGKGIDIQGKIIDDGGNPITEFTSMHEGMGRFILKPEVGKSYHAICRNDAQSMEVFLPEVKTDGRALASVWRQNKLWISINKAPEAPASKLYLLIHTGGMVIYSSEWDESGEVIAIDKTQFPSGISHLLLLTEDFQPLSERLVFALNDDWLSANVKTQKEIYETRDRVKMDIAIDCEEGNFAVSVTDDRDIQPDTASSILTTILLTSELKGSIVNPAFYFQKDDRHAELAADLLMMTHGWTRYDIPRAMRGDFQYLTVPNEESQSFSGTVKGGLFSKPYAKSKVTVISTNNSFFDQTETDENGRFTFNNFEFPDSTGYYIQALTKKGKDIVELYMDSIIYPKVSPSMYGSRKQEEQIVPKKDYIEKADKKYIQENGARTVHLPEVEIKAQKKGNQYRSPFYREADNSISMEEIEKSAAGDVVALISRVPGIMVSGKMIKLLRNHHNRPPLIKIDGFIVSQENPEDMEEAANILNSISIADIAQIDVIRNTGKLAAYGSLGFNGVIEIFTKKPAEISGKLKFNVKHILPLGYQVPVEFYSPRYDTPEVRNNPLPDLRSTVYWKPDAKIASSGTVSLDFYTADSPSTYSVLIEGVTSDGKLIYQIKRAFIKIGCAPPLPNTTEQRPVNNGDLRP
jgi:hypothetical protein